LYYWALAFSLAARWLSLLRGVRQSTPPQNLKQPKRQKTKFISNVINDLIAKM
jgi:hypothetical protein